MNILKGFVTISPYINNTPGVIAPLGELSTRSLTFSKEKGEYYDNTIPGYKLITFKSIESVSGTPIVVDATQVTQVLEIVKACVDYAPGHIQPYDELDYYNNLMVLFDGRISTLNIGEFVSNGPVALPEWISWTSLEHAGDVNKIWLSDTAFANQYDEYEIVVIPPLDVLNNFFGFFSTVSADLALVTLESIVNKIELAKNGYPETHIKIIPYDFLNANNPIQKISTNWGIVIYGEAGNNADAIKDKMIEYILANSTHTTEEWLTIFPDLFRRTEFVFIPRWDKMSIPNMVELSGLYSSILNLQESTTFCTTNIPFYTPSYIQANLTVLPFEYKTLSVLALAGPDNLTNNNELTDLFADYLPVASVTADFNRMTLNTQNWVLLMEQMLIAAETVTEFNSLPPNLHKTHRSGILFVSAVFNSINYLVAARSNAFYP